jgi:hypothetical protein
MVRGTRGRNHDRNGVRLEIGLGLYNDSVKHAKYILRTVLSLPFSTVVFTVY